MLAEFGMLVNQDWRLYTVCLRLRLPKIIAVKGMKQVGKITAGEHGKTIAIICRFNDAGTHIPQHLIFHPRT